MKSYSCLNYIFYRFCIGNYRSSVYSESYCHDSKCVFYNSSRSGYPIVTDVSWDVILVARIRFYRLLQICMDTLYSKTNFAVCIDSTIALRPLSPTSNKINSFFVIKILRPTSWWSLNDYIFSVNCPLAMRKVPFEAQIHLLFVSSSGAFLVALYISVAQVHPNSQITLLVFFVTLLTTAGLIW